MPEEVMEIVEVDVASIDANPFRLLEKYPYVERKLEALQRSFADVGMWPGVIGRRAGNRFQIAFGHHRVEAARRNKVKRIPLIVQVLSEEQMLQFMGRENMEDYNADFLCMLETWEAGAKFYSTTVEKQTQPIAVAKLLGWVRMQGSVTVIMNPTASACSAAHALISGGYIARDDLSDISVKAAKEIVERAQARIQQLDAMARKTDRSAREVERAKKHVGKGATRVAKDYRAGKRSVNELRGRVDIEAYRGAKDAKQSPLFALFARSLADSIHKMLTTDSAAEKLEQITEAIPNMTMEEDKAALRRIDFALAEHEQATARWRKRLAPRGRVIPFKLLKDEREEKDYA